VPVIVYHDLFGQMQAVEKTNPQMAICSFFMEDFSWGWLHFGVNSVSGGTGILFFCKPNELRCPLVNANTHKE